MAHSRTFMQYLFSTVSLIADVRYGTAASNEYLTKRQIMFKIPSATMSEIFT